jgi:LysR family hydrogen peroxide-inducible transcriptional activator
MELRQLIYTVKVAEYRSFSKAADALHIAQPSLSQQIQKLEQELGVQLFNRNRTLEPTYAGSRFVEQASKILDMMSQLQSEMHDMADMKRGRLRIGTLPMTGSHILPQALSQFCEQYRGIEVVLVEETTTVLEELTAKGYTDLTILSLPILDATLDWVPLIEEEICLALPPKHHLKSQVTIEVKDLQQEPFILLKPGQGFRQIAIDICKQAGFTPNIVFECSNIDTVQSLVAAGMGITFVPKMVKRSSASDPLSPIYRELSPGPLTRTLVCAFQKGRYLSKTAQVFLRILQETYHTFA